MWPFGKRAPIKSKSKEISALREQVSIGRTNLYSNLFKLDKATTDLDEMVKRSLSLLEGSKK